MQLISMDTVNQEALDVENPRTPQAGSILYALGWLLLSCLQFACECVLLAGLSFLLSILRAVTPDLEDLEDKSAISRTEVAADDTAKRVVPPLVGGSGEGWNNLYERLELVNAKKRQGETCESYSADAQNKGTELLEAVDRDEKGRKEKAFEDYRKLCSS